MRVLLRARTRSAAAVVVGACALAAALPAPAPAARELPVAHLTPNGKAHAPKGAPKRVRKMIKAANHIRDKKYKWGGGHTAWHDKGYDCSGSVSFVLHKAGLLDAPLVSGDLAKWGKPRRGRWVTIFANRDHVFMTIAGLRWDTSFVDDGDRSGPGWSVYMRPGKGFRARHPAGL